MSLKRLRHSILAIWIGVFTLVGISLEQYQLAGNVMAAAMAESHHPSEGQAQVAAHPADCPMRDAGGHTNKGHPDCAVCGVMAALTAVTLPSAILAVSPDVEKGAALVAARADARTGLSTSPYQSRGPPARA